MGKRGGVQSTGTDTDREMDGAFGRFVETGRLFMSDGKCESNQVLLSSKSALSQGNVGAKFKNLCIGDLMVERNGNVCLGVIGYGPTVCIRKNCQTKHLGGKSDLSPNNICVIKLNETSLLLNQQCCENTSLPLCLESGCLIKQLWKNGQNDLRVKTD
jgi:hypothetical protein